MHRSCAKLSLKDKKKQILGFPNYADYSSKPRWRQSADQVLEFLLDLANARARPRSNEVAERQEYAESLGFEASCRPGTMPTTAKS